MSAAAATTDATSAGNATSSHAGTWQIDPAHSGVEFAVTHLMISKVRGRFSDISGSVVTDGKPEGSRIEVEIGAASIDTHNNGRDTHLRSADFFDVEKYPKIRFASTAIKSDGDAEFRVTGDLTIRDVTKAVEMKVTAEGTGRDPWGSDRAGFSATLRIDRRDFGLTWNQALETGGVMVSNEVKLTVDVELTHKAQ
ncbi:MAG TPA: YceI family protein [Gemmatimonadaceae bacterium]